MLKLKNFVEITSLRRIHCAPTIQPRPNKRTDFDCRNQQRLEKRHILHCGIVGDVSGRSQILKVLFQKFVIDSHEGKIFDLEFFP